MDKAREDERNKEGSCCCCDPPDYEAMFEAAERLKRSRSVFDQFIALRFFAWAEKQVKPSIIETITENPLHGRVVRWKIDGGGENDRKSD